MARGLKGLKGIIIEEKNIIYTHIFVPSNIKVKLTWRDKFQVIFGSMSLQLNLYMKGEKVVHITGKLK